MKGKGGADASAPQNITMQADRCDQTVQVHIRIFNRFDMIQVVHLINEIGKPFFVQRFQHVACCRVLMLGVAFQQICEKSKLLTQFHHPVNTENFADHR